VLAERYGLHSEKQAANRYHTAEAMFQRCFRSELSEYAHDDVDAEAADVRRLLSEAGAELVERLRIDLWKDVPEVTRTSSTNAHVATLAPLLELPRPTRSTAGVLQKLLNAPLPLELEAIEPEAAVRIRAWIKGLVPSSFAGLLHHSNPLLELLELAKDFAKDHRTDPESPLGREVATVLYYAAIAVALARCGARITRHDDATLQQGFQWGCQQSWVDEVTRELFREGLRCLDSREGLPN
jgi:hypothetical protein